MNLMDRSFDPTVFTKNRKRLLEHRTGQALFGNVGVEADRQGLLSAEHFRVDGTLIESAAGIESASVLDFVKSGPTSAYGRYHYLRDVARQPLDAPRPLNSCSVTRVGRRD